MTVEGNEDHNQPRRFQSLVVGFVGDPGVGSSSICRRLLDISFLGSNPDLTDQQNAALQDLGEIQHHPLRWLLSEIGYRLPERGIDDPQRDAPDPAGLREYHEQLRADGRGSEVFEPVASRFTNGIHIIEKIRNPADGVEIRARGGFMIALVVDSPAISDARYLADTTDPKHTNGPNSEARQASLKRAKEELDPVDNSPFASDINSTKEHVNRTIDVSDDIASSTARMVAALEELGLEYIAKRPAKPSQPSKWDRLRRFR